MQLMALKSTERELSKADGGQFDDKQYSTKLIYCVSTIDSGDDEDSLNRDNWGFKHEWTEQARTHKVFTFLNLWIQGLIPSKRKLGIVGTVETNQDGLGEFYFVSVGFE